MASDQRRRHRRRHIAIAAGIALALIAACVAVTWYVFTDKLEKDTGLFQLCEAARVLEAFVTQEGHWPRSSADLEAAGVARVVSPYEFVGIEDRMVSPSAILCQGPHGTRVDLRRVAIGWNGHPVDVDGQLLLRVNGMDLDRLAALLTSQLRKIANHDNDRDRAE